MLSNSLPRTACKCCEKIQLATVREANEKDVEKCNVILSASDGAIEDRKQLFLNIIQPFIISAAARVDVWRRQLSSMMATYILDKLLLHDADLDTGSPKCNECFVTSMIESVRSSRTSSRADIVKNSRSISRSDEEWIDTNSDDGSTTQSSHVDIIW